MRTAILLTLLFLAACSRVDRPARSGVRVDTLGGVVSVWNPAPSATGQADSLFAIGTAMGDGPDAFGHVVSVVSDREGRIYVADEIANQIQVFGADGMFRASIGRQGEGPGEFSRLYSLAWLGDTLAALDPRNARITLLTRNGEPAASFRHQPLSGDRRNIRLFQTGPREIATMVVRVEDGNVARTIVRFELDGPIDTVPFPDDPWESDNPTAGGTSIVCEYPNDGGIAFFDVPFAPKHWAVPAPDGLTAVFWTADYRITFVNATGDTVRVVEREYEPIPTDPDEFQEGLAPYRKLREESPGAECRNANPSRPAFRPALHLVFFDALSRMWVEWESVHGRALDVFDSTGRQIGSIHAPRRAESLVPWVDAERLYAVTTDELGVFTVNVYALPDDIGG